MAEKTCVCGAAPGPSPAAECEQHRSKGYIVGIYPAVDVPGQWLAQFSRPDMMTQGNSPVHALRMAAEALELVQQQGDE